MTYAVGVLLIVVGFQSAAIVNRSCAEFTGRPIERLRP
jgi:hypothetical protein